MDVIDIDLRDAVRFGELRGQMLDAGTPCPDMDTLIAATALLEDLTIVTDNVSDFQVIPGLRIENWLEG